MEDKQRHSLKVAVSADDGESWTDVAELDAGIRVPGMLYHYPTLTQARSIPSTRRLLNIAS